MRSKSLNPENSIALIESTDSSRSDFGSGFMIKRDKDATYWLTCAHVVINSGGVQKIRVAGCPATLVGLSESELSVIKDTYDLAVLRVEDLYKKEPLKLISAKKILETKQNRLPFSAVGHYKNPGAKQRFMQEISGQLRLGRLNVVVGETYARVLELELNNTEFLLQEGYSGSPVIIHGSRQATYQVIGVVSQSQNDGKKGLAISIESAQGVFQKVQELRGILHDRALDSRIWLRGKSISLIERLLQLGVSPQIRKILNWLSNTEKLAKFSGDYALQNSIVLQKWISNSCDLKERDDVIDDFYWEIEKYLELIYASLLTHSQDLLENPTIRPSLPNEAYEVAFAYIKQIIPENIENNTAEKLKGYLDYLLPKLHDA